MTELSVNLTKTIQAPIEKVFAAWLDPATLTRFILPGPDMPQPEVENDAREGGRFTIVMHVGEEKIPHSGSYLTIDRPNKLVFSWESPYSTDDSQVSLIFTQVDADATNIELTHVRFINEEARSNHEGGWTNILDKLTEVF
jgi:uncharacterized protein YndB with AHSA1/START domain